MKRIRVFGRSVPLAAIAVLALATVALAAILWVQANPITGSQVLLDVEVLSVETNDNANGATGSQPDTGLDPSNATTGKHAWNIAFCGGTPNVDGGIDFTWNDTYYGEPLFCLVQASIRNNGTEVVSLESISVTDSPVIIASSPACGGALMAGGASTNLLFVMQIDEAALESGGWMDGSIDLAWALDDTLICP